MGDVCNECKNCQLINDHATIDLCEINASEYTGVDNVREIIQNVQYLPLDLHKKVYMMDECHQLTSNA